MHTERLGFGGISIRGSLRLAARIVKEQRALGRAAKEMPRPMPWDWASPRLLPLLCGPYLADDELMTDVLDPRCAVVFGVDLGRVFTLVDQEVAERWEISTGQLRERALVNLRARASRLGPEVVRRGVLSGRIVRHLGDRIPWAASLLLDQDSLTRLFGSDDQVFLAPGRGTLMSFSLQVPASVLAHIMIDFEGGEPWPLFLDPFVLIDGKLIWQPDDDEAGDAEWTS